jgi:hypothetical protein
MVKYNKIILLVIVITLSGCSTYPSRFRCGDAKGLGCTMLSEVDRQIDTGEIERIYEEFPPNCQGTTCDLKRISFLTNSYYSNPTITKTYIKNNNNQIVRYKY